VQLDRLPGVRGRLRKPQRAAGTPPLPFHHPLRAHGGAQRPIDRRIVPLQRSLLGWLLDLMMDVCSHKSVNKMSEQNLGTLPSLSRLPFARVVVGLGLVFSCTTDP
jgi:hypothetical protein